jgi:hypothetical protein
VNLASKLAETLKEPEGTLANQLIGHSKTKSL